MLSIAGLYKSYPSRSNRKDVLRGIDATFAAGACTAVIGHNGSGKSTLLRCVAGLLEPDAGDVHFRGKPVTPASGIGIIFDGPRPLYPRLRVMEVVGYLLSLLGRHSAANLEDARRILAALGANDHRSEIQQLSRGTQQKVAIAVALAGRPALVVCDEPTSFLDFSASTALACELSRVASEGACVVLATHDPSLIAATRATKVLLQDGLIVESLAGSGTRIDSGRYRVAFNSEAACSAGAGEVGAHLRERIDPLTCIVDAGGMSLLSHRFPDTSISSVEVVRWEATA